MAGDEPVTSPDQHKPTVNGRLARLGVFVVIVLLALFAFCGNHTDGTEQAWLIGIAALLLLTLIVDFFLRRTGLRNG